MQSFHDYGILPRSRSQFTCTYGNIFSRPLPFMGPLDGDDTIVVHDPGVVVAWGICPVRTCLVLLILHLNNSLTVQISS